ncbi:DUF1963 domain-containing protein [Micromonospora sp. NPDC049523]|uniref:DUF1963 domain-containing protein n=1 Tax=Micromonospora sp. NPDC049523 TaxID=3155921 RepID=UPI00341ECCE8
MDYQGQFRGAALALGVPDDEISGFGKYLRLSIRLSGGSGGVLVGQFGGLPRLPVDEDWPSGRAGQLPFIFSVDCAALPRVDGSGLPADGALLFFLDHENDYLAGGTGDQGYARVVYVPAGTDTAVAEPLNPEFIGQQWDVSASLLAEFPDWFATNHDEDEDDLSPFQQQLARDLERDVPHLDDLRALAHDLWPPDEGLASAYLGGYVDDEVITSIAEQTLAGREKAGEIAIPVAKWYSHVEEEKHRLTSEWVSLARFPVDDEFYYGSFVIRHEDLASGRLDKAYSVIELSE